MRLTRGTLILLFGALSVASRAASPERVRQQLRPLPAVTIYLYVTPGYLAYLHLGSLVSTADRLGYQLEVKSGPCAAPGYDEEKRELSLQVNIVDGPVGNNPKLLGWSHEEPSMDVSLPRVREIADRGISRYWDNRCPMNFMEYERALGRVLTYTVKHETFVHEIGQLVRPRRRPYRMDTYSPESLDSASLPDIFWDRPRALRSDHPFLLDRARLGWKL